MSPKKFVVVRYIDKNREDTTRVLTWQDALKALNDYENLKFNAHIYKLVDPVTGKDKDES